MNWDILKSLETIGGVPFFSEMVRSPWHPVVDAPLLNKEVKERVLHLIRRSHIPDALSGIVIVSPAGMGKTHLISWAREEMLSKRSKHLFVCVTSPRRLQDSFFSHLIHSIFQSIFYSSPLQKEKFTASIQATLVDVYHQLAETEKGRKVLGIKKTYDDYILRQSPSIHFPEETDSGRNYKQRKVLQDLVQKEEFLEAAYRCFRKRSHSRKYMRNYKTKMDKDIFYALCLYTFGDYFSHAMAEKWLNGNKIEPEEQKQAFLSSPKLTLQKLPHLLMTLSQLSHFSLCFCFDEVVTSYQVWSKSKNFDQKREHFEEICRILSESPKVCCLFSLSDHFWNTMTETIGFWQSLPNTEIHHLKHIDDKAALQVVEKRMKTYVWKPLKKKPPVFNPYFPLTESIIRSSTYRCGGKVRRFIVEMQEEYKKCLRQLERYKEISNLPKPLHLHIDICLVKEYRKKRLGSQRKAAEVTGISTGTISKAERGKKVSDQILFRLAEAYECSIHDFLK